MTFQDETGEVEDIRLTYTYLRLDDGRRLIIPNEQLAQTPVFNHTVVDPRVQVGVDLWLPHGADTDRALALLAEEDGVDASVAEVTVEGIRLRATTWAETPRERGPAGGPPARPQPPPAARGRPILGGGSAMTHRQRKLRRRRRGGPRNKLLLGLGVRRDRPPDRRAVGGRLRDRDRGHRPRPERAEADREGRELGDLRGRRLAPRLRALRRDPHAGPLERHARSTCATPRSRSRTSASTSTTAWT